MATWLFLAAALGALLFFIFRAWRVWQTRFANRHEFDPEHFALLMAQREEIEGPIDAQAPAPHSHKSRPKHPQSKLPGTGSSDKAARRSARPAAEAPESTPRPDSVAPPPRRKPLLDAQTQEVFLQLHADLPGYPLLSAVDIAALIDSHVAQIPRIQADFVICRKDFSPAVVIFLERNGKQSLLDRAESLLRQQRVRVLRWPVDALPAREEMRAQIFKHKKS